MSDARIRTAGSQRAVPTSSLKKQSVSVLRPIFRQLRPADQGMTPDYRRPRAGEFRTESGSAKVAPSSSTAIKAGMIQPG